MRETYWFVVVDDTRKIYSVSGPLVDDSVYSDRICDLQKQYSIHCYTVSTNDDTKENLIKYHSNGMRLVELRDIIS